MGETLSIRSKKYEIIKLQMITNLSFGELFQLWIIVSLQFNYCFKSLMWQYVELILADISKIDKFEVISH